MVPALTIALCFFAAAVAADLDGDGQSEDRVGVLADCDDGDAAVFVGAFERAGDGVDSDCDGLDDPEISHPSVCADFETPAEAWPWADDPWLGTFDAVDVVVAALNDIPSYCPDASPVDTGAASSGFADCEYGQVEWEAVTWYQSRWTAAFVFEPPTSAGVRAVAVRFNYDALSETREVSGTLAWSDGTRSEVWASAEDSDQGGMEQWLRVKSTSLIIDGCLLDASQWEAQGTDYVRWEGWSVLTPEHSVEVTWDTVTCWVPMATFDGVNVGGVGSEGQAHATPDADVDGWPESDDCNDLDSSINPCASEIANDGIDQDCSGDDFQTDSDGDGVFDVEDCEKNSASLPAWTFVDADSDGFGSDPEEFACKAGEGTTFNGGDCDDSRPTVYPGAMEVCDGHDNDCDGDADWNAEDETLWYPDHDGDGHGAEASGRAEWACDQPEGMEPWGDDCQDEDAGRHPGATEVPGDNIDSDCDGEDPAVDAGLGCGCSSATAQGFGAPLTLFFAGLRRRRHRG